MMDDPNIRAIAVIADIGWSDMTEQQVLNALAADGIRLGTITWDLTEIAERADLWRAEQVTQCLAA